MTLKHIDFHDSSVMRELERHSLKDSKVLTPTVAEIVKKASASQQFVSTGELFIDLVRLAEGLRDRGFVNYANSLESKISAYKRAESIQYNEELSAAHPDGDVTMGEASNGLADVETLESAHEKIVEVVNKKPTGKQANATQYLVANILKASEQALDIKKKAQDTSVNEDSAEDIFSGRSASRAATIKEINDFLAVQFPKIAGILRTRDIEPSKWVFTYLNIYGGTPAYRALYASRAGINPTAIEKFFQNNDSLYGKDFNGDFFGKISSMLQSYAESENYKALFSYASIVGGNIASKYFTGSQPRYGKREYVSSNPEKANDSMYKDNPTSALVWRGYAGFSLDKSKLDMAAREIQQAHYLNFQSLFSEENLTQASAKLQEEIKSTVVLWDEVTAFFDKAPELPINTTSSASLIMAINSQIDKLKPYGADGAIYKKIVELAAAVFPGWVPNLAAKATEAAKEIVTAVNFLNDKQLNSGDVIQDMSGVKNSIMTLGKAFVDAAKKAGPKSQEYSVYKENYEDLGKVFSIINASAGKPYSTIYQSIKQYFPEATTAQKLGESIRQLGQSFPGLGMSIDVHDLPNASGSRKADLTKLAIKKGPAGATMPASTSTPVTTSDAVSHGGNRANLGLAKANMNDPKEVAVATMQQYLSYFAEALASAKDKFNDYDPQDIARIVRTGPKANPAVNTYDGKWGTETQTALQLANKYLKQLGVTELDTHARYTNRITSSDAEAKAKNNASLLGQANQMLGGRSGVVGQQAGAGSIYDRLPDHIDWNSIEYPLMQHRIPVTSQDMSSLSSMYDLVIKNNWAQPKYTKDGQGFDVEGLTAGNMLFIIRWFQKRAQFVYNASVRTDKNAANLARQYYDSAKRLEGKLAAFLSARGGITQESAGNIVDIEALREYSGSGQGSTQFDQGQNNQRVNVKRVPSGAGYQGYGRAGRGMGNNGEGTDWQSPNGEDDGPPIGPNGVINLASRWFNGLDEKLGISHNPLLNPELFRRYTVSDLARTFYAGTSGNMEEQARRQALVAVGLEVESYDEGAGDYIVSYYDPTTRRKQRTYAMKVPAYQKAYKARLMAGPMRSFGALLQSISGALGPAIADWMRSVQPNDAAKQAEEAWHTEWQRILGLRANEAASQ